MPKSAEVGDVVFLKPGFYKNSVFNPAWGVNGLYILGRITNVSLPTITVQWFHGRTNTYEKNQLTRVLCANYQDNKNPENSLIGGSPSVPGSLVLDDLLQDLVEEVEDHDGGIS